MRRTWIEIILATFLFSSMEIVLKMAGSSFNAIQLNFLRFGIGGLVLLPLAIRGLKKADLKITKQSWGVFFLTGFVCVVLSMTLYQLAIQVDQASTVAVLFSSNPFFALFFSYLFLHESLSRSSIISLVISLIGLIVIVNPAHLNNPLGITLALLSALTFGLYSIISRYGSMKFNYDGIVMTAFTFIAGTIELAVMMVLTHITAIANLLRKSAISANFADIPFFKGITLANLPLLAYIAIGVTGGGFAFYFLAMEHSDVSTASLVFFIKPALAPIMAAVILGEVITRNTIIGIVIIILGSMVSMLGNYFAERSDRMQG